MSAVRALRPYQWVKNLLVFVPAIGAHRLLDATLIEPTLVAFVCFCLAASGIYVANDILDVAADRVHPRKRFRPIAAGEVSLSRARVLSAACIAFAVAGGWLMLSRDFALLLLLYVVAAAAYSFRFKREPVVDVFVLTGLYIVRVVAGGVATGVAVSTWLLAFAMFLFLSLAFVKRYTELFLVKGPLVGRGYIAADDRWLPAIGISCGYMAVLVLTLYVNAPEVTKLYTNPAALWWLCPLLLFWVTRRWFRASREISHDDPVVEALRDPVTWLLGVLGAAILYAAI